jgi:hypothetical protein
MNSTPTSNDQVPAPKTPVRFRLLYWLCAFFLVITALVFWLSMTASGTRTTFTLLEKVLPQLSVTGVSGELASDLRYRVCSGSRMNSSWKCMAYTCNGRPVSYLSALHLFRS